MFLINLFINSLFVNGLILNSIFINSLFVNGLILNRLKINSKYLKNINKSDKHLDYENIIEKLKTLNNDVIEAKKYYNQFKDYPNTLKNIEINKHNLFLLGWLSKDIKNTENKIFLIQHVNNKIKEFKKDMKKNKKINSKQKKFIEKVSDYTIIQNNKILVNLKSLKGKLETFVNNKKELLS
ncbi:hypothetical protein EHP00_1192 [Ecytonucleospora hepatopenaei]|uniref:Uncharacterized protein n=1 Tax=Ecytonucleospora hepatopenaei TaxID=646526 RepID=A0A1W0E892_9MICR|nr:hypothetical protein EHP00_1192 [Ecytonucleospora hepatopenaei]